MRFAELDSSQGGTLRAVLKVDFHIHTSDDPVDRINHSGYDLIDRAAALGFDALSVTLHDLQLADQCLRDYARERGVLLLPGVERTISGRHVVLVGFPPEVDGIRNFEELERVKKRSDGLVIAPHPFFPGPSCLGKLVGRYAELFDAIEWSYFWTRAANFNAAARRWAVGHGKPLVGNSDLHDLRQLGRTYSLVDAEPATAAILDAVREGRVRVQTEPVPAMELAQVLGGMFWRARRSSNQLEVAREESHAQFVRTLPGIAD
jgi:predicted metal-dependent phosphoesterase TrpH